MMAVTYCCWPSLHLCPNPSRKCAYPGLYMLEIRKILGSKLILP
jgi:hypothetical protein